MSADLKVVPLRRDGYSEVVEALTCLIAQLESGELEPCDTGCLLMLSKTGEVATFGFGPKSDDLQVVGLLKLGEQVIIESLLYPEP